MKKGKSWKRDQETKLWWDQSWLNDSDMKKPLKLSEGKGFYFSHRLPEDELISKQMLPNFNLYEGLI